MPMPTERWPFASDWNEVAAVYVITNASDQVIYVGETDNLKRRLGEHAANKAHAMHRYAPVYVHAEVIPRRVDRLARELGLIAEYGPPANR